MVFHVKFNKVHERFDRDPDMGDLSERTGRHTRLDIRFAEVRELILGSFLVKS